MFYENLHYEVYIMESQYLSSEYKRSRKAYITQCTLEHLIGLLVADAFLAKLLYHLGLNDALIGIISSFTSIAFVFQLMAIYIANSKLSTKKAVIISDGLSQLFFMLLYLIPFFPVSAEILWKSQGSPFRPDSALSMA